MTSEPDAQNGGAAPAAVTHCVVLTPPASPETPPALRDALEERDVHVIHERTDLRAVSRILQMCRDAKPASPAPVGLIVVDPDEHPRLRQFVLALSRYAPHVVRWRFDTEPAPTLRGLTIDSTASTPAPAARGGFALRLVDSSPTPLPGDAEDSVEGLLSPEELAMLMGDEPLDDADEARGAP